ncbi:MAG: C4-type zinc ribbon domain-containing protein [Chlamydiota bacterium]
MHQLQRDIARLLEVQEKERELLKLEEEKAALPEALDGAKAAITRAEEEVHRLKGELKALQVKKKDFELESSEKLEAVAKYQKQQFDIKTNVEYQALQKEIVNRQVENSRIEDRILEVMLDIEEHESRIRSGEELVRAKGVELAAEEKKVAEEGARVAARMAVVGAERDALLPAIDEAMLRKYQRIFKNKKDMAIVPLTDYVCGGCHMHLPPQITHLVRKGDELVICESCSRILYWAEGLLEKEPAAGVIEEKEPAAEGVERQVSSDGSQQEPAAGIPEKEPVSEGLEQEPATGSAEQK